ncbi:hypothetical protein BDF20DRAFT_840315 [Mycotypha africana]|uniref:uncharacterized protein n=1 Tax=Mycotypha africana TaxID=64632 RepID=UPI0023003F4B|nr:uncharacterized protein BDF20DRAFT_840315 [Mycotypha africana]KAI8967230.1 hypothetical protein BDF20DRAFT_840315 [Mycotypha africana]
MWNQQPISQQQQPLQHPQSIPTQPYPMNGILNMQPAFQQQYTQASVIDALNANAVPSPQQTASTSRPRASQPHNTSIQQQKQKEEKLDTTFKRQTDGPILWFAGPALNINKLSDSNTPVHSVEYLKWKREQKQMKQ